MASGHLPINKWGRFPLQLDIDDLLVAILQITCLNDIYDLNRLNLFWVNSGNVLMKTIAVDEDKRSLTVRHPDLPIGHIGI